MGIRNRKLAWECIADPNRQDLSPSDKLLLFAIADVCDDDNGVLFMGERKLAAKVGQSRAWVRQHRSALVKAGLLHHMGTWKPGQAIKWQLFPGPHVEAPDFEPPEWKPSVQAAGRDPAAVFQTGQDHRPVDDRVAPLPTHAKVGSGADKDRAVVPEIEPPEPLVRDDRESEIEEQLVSEAEGFANAEAEFVGSKIAFDSTKGIQQ